MHFRQSLRVAFLRASTILFVRLPHVCTFIYLGKIPIETLLRSDVMGEFIELRGDPDSWLGGGDNNWFWVENIMRIYQEVRETFVMVFVFV